MPRELFTEAVKNFRQSVCDIRDLRKLADRLGTSFTSTAVRYCDCDIEPAMAIFSENGIVRWTYFSQDMKDLGCWFVRFGTQVPGNSQTAKLLKMLEIGPTDEVVGHRIDPHVWFEWPKCKWLYEESVQLGNRILTWLAVDD